MTVFGNLSFSTLVKALEIILLVIAQIDTALTTIVISVLALVVAICSLCYTVWKQLDQFQIKLDCRYVDLSLARRCYRVAVYNTGNKPISIRRAWAHHFELESCIVRFSESFYDGATHDEEMVLMPGAKKVIPFEVDRSTCWSDHIELELHNGKRFQAVVEDTGPEHLMLTSLATMIGNAVHLSGLQGAIFVHWDTNNQNARQLRIDLLFHDEITLLPPQGTGEFDPVYDRLLDTLPRLFVKRGREYHWSEAVLAFTKDSRNYEVVAPLFGWTSDSEKCLKYRSWVDSRQDPVRGNDFFSKSFF